MKLSSKIVSFLNSQIRLILCKSVIIGGLSRKAEIVSSMQVSSGYRELVRGLTLLQGEYPW